MCERVPLRALEHGHAARIRPVLGLTVSTYEPPPAGARERRTGWLRYASRSGGCVPLVGVVLDLAGRILEDGIVEELGHTFGHTWCRKGSPKCDETVAFIGEWRLAGNLGKL